jgi:hypothetical protein
VERPIARAALFFCAVVLVSIYADSLHILLAAEADKAALLNAPPLEVLSASAAVAASLAIAYAGLPSFRYRLRVEGHVRRRVREENLIPNLYLGTAMPDSAMCGQDSWGILYRLGKLREVRHAPAPIGEVDRNFSRTPSYMVFAKLFASNLDKWLAISLGALSISVVWFAALDNIHFHGAHVGDAKRMEFLSLLECTYMSIAVLGCILFVIHILSWQWEMPKVCKRQNIIKWTARLAVFVAAMVFFLASTSEPGGVAYGAASKIVSSSESGIFLLLEKVLIFTIIIPSVLLVLGESLTQQMIQEADLSLDTMVDLVARRAKEAKIKPKMGATVN